MSVSAWGGETAVTILDLLAITPSPTSTYIIKTDIEGFDCKVAEKRYTDCVVQ